MSAMLAGSFLLASCERCQSDETPGAHEVPDEGSHSESPAGEHADHGEHAHHADPSQDAIGITRFSEKLELFAEHPPAVAGQELSFLAHLTILERFRALDNATVTLVLAGPSTVQTQLVKLRPGVFRGTLTAPAPAKYGGKLIVTGPEVEDTLEGFDIVFHTTEQAASEAPAVEEAVGADSIAFFKEQQWQVPFGTAFATEGFVMPSIEVTGEVTTPPSGQAEVEATTSGRVVAPPKGLPRPGQTVKRGELLATIAPAPAAPESGARADLAVVEAQARVQAARAAVERAERLIADRAISQREVDEAHRELRVAEETEQTASRAQRLFSGAASGRGVGTYRIAAPIDGVVVDVKATAGKSVTSGELLFLIVNLNEIWIRARVPEQEATLLRADYDAAFKLPGIDAWWPLDVTGDDASASVVNIARTVDPRSRTVNVIYALRQSDERLRVGAMVHVAVPAGNPWRGVLVPRGAVLDDDGRSLVYVQIDGETFEERVVELGPRSGSTVGVQRGVTANERVVTRGANIIRLSSRASSTPAHGHVH